MDTDAFLQAARSGDTETLGHLLSAHPDLVHAYSNDGWTALHLAAYFGHVEAVSVLLTHQARVQAVSKNAEQNTPLHAALAGERNPVVIEKLLEQGAEVEAVAAQGVRPLHLAAAQGDLPLIQRFLARGADPAAPLDSGQTPADLAEARGHPEAAALLRGKT